MEIKECEKDNAIRLQKAMEFYISGLTINKISKELHMDSKRIRKAIDNNGIEFRPEYTYHVKYKVNENYFDIIDTEEKAYWFGFLMADGCVRNTSGSRLTIELAKKDESHIQKFLQSIESNYPIRSRRENKISCLSINNRKLVNDLIVKGCVPNKTCYGFVAKDCFKNEYLKTCFLRGYFDGNGYIEKI